MTLRTLPFNYLLLLFLVFYTVPSFGSDRSKLDSLLQLSQIEKVESNLFKLQLQIGNYYQRLKLDSAFIVYNRIIFSTQPVQDGRNSEHVEYFGRALFQKGMCYLLTNQIDSAIIFLHRSDNIIRAFLDETDSEFKNTSTAGALASINNELAEIHANNSSFEKAISYNDKSIQVCNKYHLRMKKAYALLTRSKIYYYQEKYEKAKQQCYEALSLAILLVNKDLEGRVYNNIGALLYYEQKWDSCAYYFEKAYEIVKSNSRAIRHIPALNNLGLIYNLNKKHKKALFYLKKAEALADLNKVGKSKVTSLFYQVITYLDMHDYENARNMLEKFETANNEHFNLEKKKQIEELETKYQSDLKEQQIASLEKENLLKSERVKSQRRVSVLLIVLFVLSAVLVYFYFVFSKNRQRNIKNKLIIKSLRSEQKVLRSQMNPHFIYNSLNSIQSFISSDDSYQAEKYLSRFARLMRGILENSRHEFVVLEKELEVLMLYLELEQLRFEKRFDFRIDISDEVEPEFIRIPPMILQPFIENAILHGFYGVKDGMLTLSIAEENDRLKCVVDDNGIGRKKAAEKTLGLKKESLASKITHERLLALSEQTGKTATFEIIDKTNKQGEPTGTRVIINLPLFDIK